MLTEIKIDHALQEQGGFMRAHSSEDLLYWSDNVMKEKQPHLFSFIDKNRQNFLEKEPDAGRIYESTTALTFLTLRRLKGRSLLPVVSDTVLSTYRLDAIDDLYNYFVEKWKQTSVGHEINYDSVIDAFDRYCFSAPKFTQWTNDLLKSDEELEKLLNPHHLDNSDMRRYFMLRGISDVAYPLDIALDTQDIGIKRVRQ